MKCSFASALPMVTLAVVGTVVTSVAPAQATGLSFRSCAGGTGSSAYNLANNFTGESACTIYTGSANNDSVGGNDSANYTVNTEKFFGFTDWKLSHKEESFTNAKSGTWDISSRLKDNWENVMMVFKSGSGTKLTAYNLAQGTTSGTWSSPFLKTAFGFGGNGTVKDVSHISFYYRETSPGDTNFMGSGGNSAAVPEPATMLGVVTAGGMLFGSKKLKRKAS
jgi:hypothetical protein